MKKFILVGLIPVFLTISCKQNPIELDYCKMLSEDQSYIDTNKADVEKYNSNRMKRRKIFKKNFKMLMNKTRQDGFPFVNIENYPADSCKYWAVSMTMIHTAQSSPELFFSKKYANIFKSELDIGNIERKLLEEASIFAARKTNLCEELKKSIKYSVDLWGINFSIFDTATFVKCK